MLLLTGFELFSKPCAAFPLVLRRGDSIPCFFSPPLSRQQVLGDRELVSLQKLVLGASRLIPALLHPTGAGAARAK